jgi:hypothetical protein
MVVIPTPERVLATPQRALPPQTPKTRRLHRRLGGDINIPENKFNEIPNGWIPPPQHEAQPPFLPAVFYRFWDEGRHHWYV